MHILNEYFKQKPDATYNEYIQDSGTKKPLNRSYYYQLRKKFRIREAGAVNISGEKLHIRKAETVIQGEKEKIELALKKVYSKNRQKYKQLIAFLQTHGHTPWARVPKDILGDMVESNYYRFIKKLKSLGLISEKPAISDNKHVPNRKPEEHKRLLRPEKHQVYRTLAILGKDEIDSMSPKNLIKHTFSALNKAGYTSIELVEYANKDLEIRETGLEVRIENNS